MADLPQDEPSDDFKAGWDKAIAVAAFLVTPKPLPSNSDALDNLAFKNANSTKAAISKLAGQYQFRHIRAGDL